MVTESKVASLEAIALADDLSAVRAIEYIYERVGSVPAGQHDEQLDVPPEPTLQALLRSIDRNDQQILLDAESICAARWLLCQFAQMENGPLLVRDALENWNDETQSVGVRLQWTLIGTLLLCVATTEVEVDSSGFRIHKKAIVPQQVEATARFLRGKISIKVLDEPEKPNSPESP